MVRSCFWKGREEAHVQSLGIALEHLSQPQLLELLLESTGQARIHAAASAEHDGLVQATPHIHLRCLDGVEQELRHARLLDVDQMRLEQAFRRLESFATHADDSSVRQGVTLHEDGGVFAEPLIQLEVVRHVTELLLDLSNRLKVGRAVESVAPSQEQRDELPSDVSSGHVESSREMIQHGGFVDGDDVGDAVTRIDDHAAAQS